MAATTLHAILVLGVALVAGCAVPDLPTLAEPPPPVYQTERFNVESSHAKRYPRAAEDVCEGARRALLGQGYVLTRNERVVLVGTKYFQPDKDRHVELKLQVTCVPQDATDRSAITLAHYAERAYLEYALSVVKGRALPDVCDGAKPVQRRILYAMQRMGLGFTGPGGGPKPVKSARVVGDVLGRFHPHGDQAAYDALVRMAQDFSQRYPLIDGQGNFGSRDGDGAAAMRYTEARLAPIARLLLDEIDEGTVDFSPTTTAAPRSRGNCRRACRSRCSTAPAASPWAWPPRSPATTCARWRPPRWR
jgi:hypothetical protein